MTRYDLIISGARVLTGHELAPVDVAVADGKIAAIGTLLEPSGERLDAGGLLILPGIVDPHVHPIHAEDYFSVSEAAAFGGITTLLHHLYVDPDQGAGASLRRARADADARTILDYSFHVRLAQLNRTGPEIPDLIRAGVTSFKLFMAYRGRGIMMEDVELFDAMLRIAKVGGVALVHAENGGVIDVLEREAEAAGRTLAHDYPATRPRWAEAEAVYRATSMARMARCPIYVVHTTCIDALRLEAQAKLDGVAVYAETCPQYLLLTEDVMREHGARAKIAPPLRTAGDVEALWHGLRSGLVDTIGSDHSAFGRKEKEGFDEDILHAGFGAPGVEHMLPLLYDRGVRSGRISLARLVDLMSTNPSRIFGLSRKGEIRVGADADLVLFDPERDFTIEAARGHGRAYYSLYEGWTGRGQVSTVLQRGKFVIRDGERVARPGAGRFHGREPVSGPARYVTA